ncbi:sulfatase [Thermodesulfobacteriota bacterium]
MDGDGDTNRWLGGIDPDDLDSKRGHLCAEIINDGIDQDGLAGDLLIPQDEFIQVLGNELESARPALPTDNSRPNLILISLDPVRADHLGCYGYSRPTSPNIDRLAEEGVLFSNVISPSSWTLPSHASMLTGLFPTTHGVNLPEKCIPTQLPYLPSLLKEQGYYCAAFTSGGFASRRYFGRDFAVYKDLDFHAQSTFSQAREFILDVPREPFFLFLHTYQPHAPYGDCPWGKKFFSPEYPPLPFESPVDLPPDLFEDIQGDLRRYDADILWTDYWVGRFLDSLHNTSLGERSVVLLVSDHGEQFYEHGESQHGVSLHAEELRVPLIIAWPERLPKGVTCDAPANLIDLFPTLLHLAGASLPAIHHGIDLLWLMKMGNHSRPRYSCLEYYHHRLRQFAVVKDKFKLILSPEIQVGELYDLLLDPWEVNNLNETHPERSRQYREELENAVQIMIYQRYELHESSEKIEIAGELREDLRALGYIR